MTDSDVSLEDLPVRDRRPARAVPEARARFWDVTPELLCIVDDRGRIERVNPACSIALGTTSKRLAGIPFLALLHVDDELPARRALEALAADDARPARFETRSRGGDCGWRWLSWTAASADGRIHCSARDVTARRQREAELAAAGAALRRAETLATIDRLVGEMAHDVNNLLMAVQSSVELLGESVARDDADGRELVDTALAAAARGASQVRRLIALTHHEALDPTATDVVARVEAMRALLVHSLGPGVLLTTDCAADTPAAYVDGDRLELVVLSLALAARDAMGGEGTLSVAVGPVPDDLVRLEIGRTGVDGTPRDQTVEPLFKAEDVRRGGDPELSMVREFCALSGGTFHLDTDDAAGACARILLPVARDVPRAAPSAPAAPAVPSAAAPDAAVASGRPSSAVRSLRVLVVDDDELVLRGMVRQLDRLGHDVLSAPSGASALRLLARGDDVDVLVTDQLMPGMTGVQLAIEARRVRPALPVVLSSGCVESAAVQRGLIAAHLRKPFDRLRLERVLARVCAHRPIEPSKEGS